MEIPSIITIWDYIFLFAFSLVRKNQHLFLDSYFVEVKVLIGACRYKMYRYTTKNFWQ